LFHFFNGDHATRTQAFEQFRNARDTAGLSVQSKNGIAECNYEGLLSGKIFAA